MSEPGYDETVRQRHAAPTRHQAGRSGPADPHPVLGLQRSAGNAAVVQLLAGQDDEGHDQESERVVPRSPVLGVVGRGGGSPLPGEVRQRMEGHFGADFGDVRVHTDGAADHSARAVGAHAYTVGSDLVFRSGAYDPASPTGQRTIAHELTHVVQQRSGPVDGTPTGDGVSVSDPSDRFERDAESTADGFMSTGGLAGPAATGPAVQALTVQRVEEPPEEDPAVPSMVQRADAPEEEEMAAG